MQRKTRSWISNNSKLYLQWSTHRVQTGRHKHSGKYNL